MPMLPFENPLHALGLMGMGVAFWTIGTAIREIGKQPEQMREYNRHNPWTMLFKGRPNSKREEKEALPDAFFNAYRAFGSFAAWLGYLLLALGFTSLLVLLSKKLF